MLRKPPIGGTCKQSEHRTQAYIRRSRRRRVLFCEGCARRRDRYARVVTNLGITKVYMAI